MKKLLLLFYATLVGMLCANSIHAQTLTLSASPDNVCLGANVVAFVRFEPDDNITFDKIEFDMDSDGTPEQNSTNKNFQYGYPAPGTYTITATAVMPNGTRITSNPYQVTVATPPTADFTVDGSSIQCFRGNRFQFTNTSVAGSKSITRLVYVFGDGERQTIMNPVSGASIYHSYQFGDTFNISVEVIDENGCTSLSPEKKVVVKENLDVQIDALGTLGCFGSPWTLRNLTQGIQFSQVRKYTWDFGDGTSITREVPWSLPNDSNDYYSIQHVYNYMITNGIKSGGTFFPALIIEDVNGCIDSVRMNANGNPPQNFYFEFNIIPTKTGDDTIPRLDSACFGFPHNSTVYFYHAPIELSKPGDWLWNFGDPNSQQLNFDNKVWWPSHEFTDICDFTITLTHFPCDTSYSIGIRILGPQTKIEDPPNNIKIDDMQKYQCLITQPVEFPNTSKYCYSDHMYRLWDFGDDFAPRCTSFSIGTPPPGGWVYQNPSIPMHQHTSTVGYWIQNGVVYPGKRMDCNYSHDTLPVHKYQDWQTIFLWHKNGHDFMPWDFNRYTRNPADTMPGPGQKFWVPDYDTLYWGKPVYLNPSTGAFTLTQGTYFDPVLQTNVQFPRIDTIEALQPQDLEPYNRITINRGVPDPFTMVNGEYNLFPIGLLVDPKNQPSGLNYIVNGKFYNYQYNRLLPGEPETLYEYIFYREVQKCHTVKLVLQDSLNNGTDYPYKADDYLVLDEGDCTNESTVQLALVKPDARGLGKAGRECPGSYNPTGNGIRFHMNPVTYVNEFTGQAFNYPGINPSCGQTFIEINIDSLADRMDDTPCNLDGFTTWEGGVTPGGLTRPVFTNAPDWNNPMQFWQDARGTSTWYHYGPPTSIGGQNTPPPADPRGFVTVGIRVGAGYAGPNIPMCFSNTVWYHNFLFFRTLDADFFLDPTYNASGVAQSLGCKEYCKNDKILFVYADSTQDSVGLSMINWGDNTYTIDSFMYEPGRNDGVYVNGFRRVRVDLWEGACREHANNPIVLNVQEFPNGLPGVDVDTVWHENYIKRLHPSSIWWAGGTNTNGSLIILQQNGTQDSILIDECGTQYWMALADTLQRWYYPEVKDKSMMLLPIEHQFFSSTFENGCKRAGTAPNPVTHVITSVKGCVAVKTSDYLVVRGVIDTAMVRNSKMEFDTVFCVGEPVHFYDSVRYWRPDCSLSDPIFNPNLDWGGTLDPLGRPQSTYHFDTTDYWARETGNPDYSTGNPLAPYVEKMYWKFGDGDSAEGVRPIHVYKNPGRYVVEMRTIDRMGCEDTSWCYVYVTEPNAEPTVRAGVFNCGATVTFYDKSYMTSVVGNEGSDSIKNNYWWFGERKSADTLTRFDAFNDDTALWVYRKNGYFDVKLVVESHQGCKDTGWVKVFIEGPRPKIAVITDTIGCVPFTVAVVNLADTDNPDPSKRVTKVSQVSWGAGQGFSDEMFMQYDTVYKTYYDSGTYYISVVGDDTDPMNDNVGCKRVVYPDTIDNFEAPIRITVKRSYPAEIEVKPQTVCVDQEFTITNLSDTVNYTEFKYSIYTGDTVEIIDSFIRSNQQNVTTRSIDSIGRYLVVLEPTKFAPGVPECKLLDTVVINVVKPTAGIVIDTTSIQNRNESQFIFNVDTTIVKHPENKDYIYDWIVYKVNEENNPFKQVQDLPWANRDLGLVDFGLDTGTYVVCLSTYTIDPAKPICADTICDTVEYKFVVKMEIFNVFTPDGDGNNDVFDIDIEGEVEYDLVIYNRWGTKVFESKEDGEKGDGSKNWNGKNMNSGSDCPAGTYFYVFKYKLRTGVEETLNGTITLIR